MCDDKPMLIIKCKKCRAEKADSNFKLWRGRRNAWCEECRKRNNLWYKKDEDGRRTKRKLYYQQRKHKVAQYRSDLRLNRKYNLTREEWNEMLASQEGLCGICRGVMKAPCVDHNHETGKVRGLLHRGCNLKLQVIEDAEFLKNAHTYLDSMK